MHKRRGVLGKHQKKNALGYALGFVGPHKFLPFTDTSMPIFYLVKTKTRMVGSVTIMNDHTEKRNHMIKVT